MKRILSILLALLMIATTIPFAFAADECTEHSFTWVANPYTDGTLGTCSVCSEKAVVINLSNWQDLYINSQGYRLGNDETVPFEGLYILSGNTGGTITFSSGTYDAVFHNLTVENSLWDKSLGLNSTTLNAVAYGVNRFVGYNHAGLSGGHSTLNLTVAENSSVYFDAEYEDSNYFSVNPETTLNIVSGTPSADMSGEDWYYSALTVSNGTPKSHEYTVETDTENDSCKRSCCSYIFNLTHFGDATCSVSDTCLSCGKTYYDNTVHELWNQGVCACGKVCEHNDSDYDGFCNICDYFIGAEIKVGDTIEVDTSKGGVYIKFVAPETTKYVLRTQGSGERVLVIYNEERDSGYEYYTEDDFKFADDFVKNEVYFIKFSTADSSDTFSFSLSAYCTEHSGTLQTCKGYVCDNCGGFFGEEGSCAGVIQTCLGYKCEGCGEWYGEKGEHTLEGEQTCSGYYCTTCEGWYGEKADHTPSGDTACGRNYCCECERWYGEPTGEHVDDDSDGLCDDCDFFLGEEIKVGGTFAVVRKTFLKFVPTVSGRYILSSSNTDTCDPYVELYNSNLYYIDDEDDSFEERLDFSLDYEYTAGETYYFSLYDYNGSYEDYTVTLECYEHQGGKADCTNKAKCEACGASYGEVDADGHDWSNLDGVCASGCGFVCAHENVTDATCVTSALCDVCGLEVYDYTNHEGEYVTVWYNDYQHVSEYECCHIGSSIVYGDHDYKDYTVTTPADCVNNAWETGTCICGGTHVREIADSATDHNWSNKDGICANGCGETCPHESYTGGVCDNCAYECSHEWGEGVLTRPTFETAGYYTYTCTLCGHSYTEPTKKADITALNDASMKVTEYIDNDTLTQEAKDEIYNSYRDILKNNGNIFDEFGFVRGDLIEEDQPAIDAITEELQKIIDDADEKIASGEYVKIDGIKEYNKIADALDAELMENYSQEEIAALAEKAGDEINARFGEIIEKAEALTGTVAENKDALAEIESELSALYAEMKNCLDGVHNGFVYEVTEEAKCEVNAIESAICTLCGETDEREVEGTALSHSFTKYEVTEEAKCGKAGKEVAYCDHGCQTTDEREIPALEHIFVDYKSNGDATCEADGTKTASCIYGCGATDTVADEGTKLSHTDEDGDKLCDDCQAEIKDICPDCGRPVHEEKGVPQYICLIITLIRLVVSFVKAIAQK